MDENIEKAVRFKFFLCNVIGDEYLSGIIFVAYNGIVLYYLKDKNYAIIKADMFIYLQCWYDMCSKVTTPYFREGKENGAYFCLWL